jgi:chromosomal replication initiator protein
VQKVVAKEFDVTIESLAGKGRTHQVAVARQLAMYVIKRRTGMTLVEIGRSFGKRDHSTVIYALDRMTSELSRDEALRGRLAAIEAELDRSGGFRNGNGHCGSQPSDGQ